MWYFCVRNALKTKGLPDNNPNSVSKLIPGQEDKLKNILKKCFLEKALLVLRHEHVRHSLCGLQLVPLSRFWEQPVSLTKWGCLGKQHQHWDS